MIINGMRLYDYVKLIKNDSYGQEIIPPFDTAPLGQVKMSIYPSSVGTQENILYADCAYVGFTFNYEIDDKYVIQYGKERIKVMYDKPYGRMIQVFMKRVN
jgi:hypothetical protein